MKVLRITKGFAQLLHMLRAKYITKYETLTDVLNHIIVGNDEKLMLDALELSKQVVDDKKLTNIMINNETITTLKIVQTRYKKRYNKVVALGEIAESLCTKSLRSACYRELMNEGNNND